MIDEHICECGHAYKEHRWSSDGQGAGAILFCDATDCNCKFVWEGTTEQVGS